MIFRNLPIGLIHYHIFVGVLILKDIAVLARRNVDVKNIVLALAKKSIPAVASGIITADGSAGDLANILTFADKPRSSLPGLIYCLERGKFSDQELDEIIADSLENFEKDGEDSVNYNGEKAKLISEVSKIHSCSEKEKFSSDAFSMICVFLFESSPYLRTILNSNNEVEKSLIWLLILQDQQ